jgi:tyrosine-protein phosphatase non-receptor type 9
LKFLKIVRAKQSEIEQGLKTSKNPPMIVHCSAGIGRTGTFVTLDISINRLKKEGKINIRKTVEKIRLQRASAVQTSEQYVFCHTSLLDYAQSDEFLNSN